MDVLVSYSGMCCESSAVWNLGQCVDFRNTKFDMGWADPSASHRSTSVTAVMTEMNSSYITLKTDEHTVLQ